MYKFQAIIIPLFIVCLAVPAFAQQQPEQYKRLTLIDQGSGFNFVVYRIDGGAWRVTHRNIINFPLNSQIEWVACNKAGYCGDVERG